MEKIRVVQLTSGSNLGGIEKMLATLVPGFDPQRYSMTVLNLRGEGEATEFIRRHGVRSVCLHMRSLFDVPAFFRLVGFLRKERIQLLHIYGFSGNIVGRIAARLAGVPVVLTGQLSTDGWRNRFHSFLDKWTSRFVDAYVCNCKACGDALVERDGIDPSKIAVVYDGIDASVKAVKDGMEVRRSLGIPDELPLIGLVANLRPMKGHKALLEAASIMKSRKRDFMVLCAGTDFMGGKIQRMVRERELDDHFLFTGYREDILDLIGACDVVVQPSAWEGFPISILEGMAMAKPIVAFRVSGIPEQVAHGCSGFLVEPGNVEELVQALDIILDNPGLAREMGSLGRNRVTKMFGVEGTIGGYEKIYKELIAGKVGLNARRKVRAGSTHRPYMHHGSVG